MLNRSFRRTLCFGLLGALGAVAGLGAQGGGVTYEQLVRAGESPASVGEMLRFGRLVIDRAARRVLVDGEERALTGHQFDLLCVLAESARRLRPQHQLPVVQRHTQGLANILNHLVLLWRPADVR